MELIPKLHKYNFDYKNSMKLSYEGACTDKLIQLVKKSKCFVDVGAYFGYYTILATYYMPKNGHIWCFEPDIRRLVNLKRNILLLKQYRTDITYHVYNIALSNKEVKNATLLLSEGDVSSRLTNIRPHIRKLTKSTTIDVSYLDKFNINTTLIKIDVEGEEFNVLRGAIKILEKGKTNFIIEIHTSDLENQIKLFLKKYGYKGTPLYQKNRFIFTK